ncbi:Fur family ferric uptake transcriptional regulator [Curtobacterium sp. PhB25]|nr:Fur family ferric uptake transcriptional regulator [Curtobacterium sp. PhB146]TCU83480.1 Fur family ferric uptake transcriptional regulator [Curtobacterium sp. PhB191]TDW44369.1 Fur family ferric uptake transcriptional regulator [Curtobacterium sp. PhB42]TDW54070.1 Fur family ferric uptake transcriptional regulator [Curtobacterium sp. PhB190]TDW66974.1 Fur family ferric uptake transcriptional regulator [Curtobacterium sp. PhB25]
MDADADLLRTSGLRVTTPRLAVLRATESMPHATADDIVTALTAELPTTSHQAVYGVLAALTGVGLVRRIEPAGSPARYERRTGDNHHHIVCTLCGAIEDVDCAVGHSPCLTPSDAHGFAVTTAEVTYWGICERCAAAERDDAGDDAAGDAGASAIDAGASAIDAGASASDAGASADEPDAAAPDAPRVP